jgi:hypothetical protein
MTKQTSRNGASAPYSCWTIDHDTAASIENSTPVVKHSNTTVIEVETHNVWS